jgi:hypothetical protein
VIVRSRLVAVSSKRIERQIDDVLLATSVGTGFLYVRRRVRRLLSNAVLGATVLAGATALGAAGAAALYRRNRGQRS